MTKAMPITTTDSAIPSGFNVVEVLHKMDSKLSVIKHSIKHGMLNLDEIELYGIETMTEEIQNSLEQVMDYYRELEN